MGKAMSPKKRNSLFGVIRLSNVFLCLFGGLGLIPSCSGFTDKSSVGGIRTEEAALYNSPGPSWAVPRSKKPSFPLLKDGIKLSSSEGIPLINADVVDHHEFGTRTSQLTFWRKLQWYIRYPLDGGYMAAANGDITKADSVMQKRINEIEGSDAKIREEILGVLRARDGRCKVPFPVDDVAGKGLLAKSSWDILGRSVSTRITLRDGSSWSLVFKGLPAGTDPSHPIKIAPSLMDNWSRPDNSIMPALPWVLQFSESRHSIKKQWINSYGLRAALSFWEEIADTAIPIAMLELPQIPVRNAKGKVEFIDAGEYFNAYFDDFSYQDKKRFLRFLRIDMDDLLTRKEQADVAGVLFSRNIGALERAGHYLLKSWRPKIYCYLVKGNVTDRVERMIVRRKPKFDISRELVDQEKILRYYGFNPKKQKVTKQQRISIARSFAGKLSLVAYYHKLGGDFGGRDGSLSPKDITIGGAILDFDMNVLPSTGGLVYRFTVRPLKLRWNIINAKAAITKFGEALGLEEGEIKEIVDFFMKEYRQRLKSKFPGKPYISIWNTIKRDSK